MKELTTTTRRRRKTTKTTTTLLALADQFPDLKMRFKLASCERSP